mmetsp:Transcript_3176/g.4744  ORF Transcript_3176/g.4744 Transcript_3176/m.4744 type:complete len:642 (-) Transcript_3176:117-2042(-)|eukprot:CAMPEP_0172421620 /NCGR_PEP_ID=MMETSP1064-20121228/7848_1 /TAXON_ID=202472 /ORGANISM="Aulacoseira subarctica , Strain CCAP 1002/5" /LENGTH=641 /DNA_ID=CAMNT_0013162109 /DNA_START=79 /DNA_END=2004 /DNA_ORIENTATION=+
MSIQGDPSLRKDAKIGIVGGGIGGLSTALALKNSGFTNVIVYERDLCLDPVRRDGYGLTLVYNPKGPLAKLGILEQVCLQDTPSRSHYIFQGPHGNLLGYYGRAFLGEKKFGQRGNLRIPRQKLREILVNRLLDNSSSNDTNSIEVRWGKRLVHFVDRSQINNNTSDSAADLVTLTFSDGTSDNVELMIAADGIRSTVQSKIQEFNEKDKPSTSLQYIGVMLINGITSGLHHPLLDERGFYTVDGENRLFTMPFEGSNAEDHLTNLLVKEEMPQTTRRRTMWQLSFRLPDIERANQLRQGGPQVLLEEVLRRCASWHSPVCDMFRSTPLENIWGAGLMDRMPMSTNRHKMQRRVVVLGDAMHAMSPFKGQGANQALSDGPLLAEWLCRSKDLKKALNNFEREMINRTRQKVLTSREAAQYLHSPAVLQTQQDFSGVPKDILPLFLNELKSRNIGAHLGAKLDDAMRHVLQEMVIAANIELSLPRDPPHEDSNTIFPNRNEVLTYARNGDLSELRSFSLLCSDPIYIRSARLEDTGETCLHLAAKNGHYDVCKWLISEGYFSAAAISCYRDNLGRCPLTAAIAGKADPKVIAIILAVLTTKDDSSDFLTKELRDVVENIKDEDNRCTVIQLLARTKYRINNE